MQQHEPQAQRPDKTPKKAPISVEVQVQTGMQESGCVCNDLFRQPYNGLHLRNTTSLALHDSLGSCTPDMHATLSCLLMSKCLPSLPAAIHVDIRDLQQDLSYFIHVLICARAILGLP